MSIAAQIDRLLAGEDLGREGAAEALDAIMGGHVDPVQTGAFLIALRAKGETAAELAGLASVVRARSESVWLTSTPLVDTCGTGGGRSTFNVSTAAAFVVAGAGVAVAKHGNRSATSRSGSADVLEALGAQDRPVAGGRGPVRGARRGGVHVRPVPSPRIPAHRTGAPGTRRADDLQSAWSADKSGRRTSSGDRGVRPVVYRTDRHRAGRARRRARAGGLIRGRAGRDLDGRADDRSQR